MDLYYCLLKSGLGGRLALNFSSLPPCHLPIVMDDELAAELAALAHSKSLWHKTVGLTEVGCSGSEG